MFKSHRYRAILCLKGITTFATTSPTPKPFPFFHHYPLPFSPHFCTTTSEPRSFAVSYLIKNFGFSPESAFKASKHVRIKSSEKPDSVLNFFKNHGFSNSQMYNVIKRAPWLLSCDPDKRVLPKFEFFLSKGASTSDIVRMVTKNAAVLQRSLENHMIPTYELLHRFIQSDKVTIGCIIHNPGLLTDCRVSNSIQFLVDNGMTDSSIAFLLRMRSKVLCSTDLLKVVEEVKDLGFNPSKSTFSVALIAKKMVIKTRWDEKVDVFKKWGWSDETILQVFRRQPNCMLVSSDKINAVMSFWVNQLGWDAMALVRGPEIFLLSLEKRIIPRASVVQFLLKNGLRTKNASLFLPFTMSEKLFLNKFVSCFKEESSHLLKMYEEKLNLAYDMENTSLWHSPSSDEYKTT